MFNFCSEQVIWDCQSVRMGEELGLSDGDYFEDEFEGNPNPYTYRYLLNWIPYENLKDILILHWHKMRGLSNLTTVSLLGDGGFIGARQYSYRVAHSSIQDLIVLLVFLF